MSIRRGARPGSEGFTLVEIILFVVGVGILITFVVVTINLSDPKHKALKARALTLCNTPTAVSPDSFTVTAAEVPGRVERDLSASLSPLRTRYLHWRRTVTPDGTLCEMQYCYTGRNATTARPAKNCTPWERTA